jgi:type II secretory pathway component PulF
MMALFSYQALRDNGERVAGTIEGADRSLVMSRLAGQGLHPIEVREQGAESGGGAAHGLSQAHVKSEEITVFTRQLAWLLDAGTTLNRALDILARESFSKRFSAVLSALQSDIRKGKSFRDALAASGVFAPFYLSMVEVGEATGTLAAVLDRLAGAREREQKTRGKVISALTYPLLLVVLSIGVIIFIMVSVVPGIKDMILGSGAPIPDSARLVIGASDWLIANGRMLAVGLALAALAAALLWQRTSFPRMLRDVALSLPGVGAILMKAEVAQFCRILGALTAAGMTLTASLKLIGGTKLNRRITGTAKAMETALRRGEDFIAPLEASGIFPPLLARMLKVGSETGNLTPGINRASEVLEDELDRAVDRALALLGPLIIMALSVFVGFIIVSLMGAVISINDLAI